MPISRLSYTFLLTFIGCVFVLCWFERPSYPIALWMILGLVGAVSLLGLFLRGRSAAALILAISLAATLALLSVSRIAGR